MHILIIGNSEQAAIVSRKIAQSVEITHVEDALDFDQDPHIYDAIIDFDFVEYPEMLDLYEANEKTPVFVNSIKSTLYEASDFFFSEFPLFGFNGLPYFVEQEAWEVSLMKPEHKALAMNLSEHLGIRFMLVDDRVGMVSARVVSMIINEAYYTLQEGTASKKDIDLGMKLGTNYPYGPFEWADLIGIENVYELLDALYNDTKDPRYKICPLLKKEYILATK
jgi:3-hydroxybutyryl-CoA dehydrogenase